MRKAIKTMQLILMLTVMHHSSLAAQASRPIRTVSDVIDAGVLDAAACTVAEVSSEWLRVDGQVVYIEPSMAESNSRGDVFLAGSSTLVGVVDSFDHWRPTVKHGAVVGALLPKAGSPRLVASPFPKKRLGGFHALPRGDSSWLVVFGERISEVDGTYGDSSRALWVGHYDGRRWSALRRLPSPAPGTYELSDASALVARGDTIWWAIRKTAPHSLLVLEGVRGGWTFNTINRFLHSPMLARDSILQMATVGPDQTLPSDGNSLWVWAKELAWRPLTKLVPSQQEEVHRPSIMSFGDQEVITWMSPPERHQGSGFQLRAVVTRNLVQHASAFTVDSAMSGLPPFSPLTLLDGRPLWISDHARGNTRGEIQFATYDPFKAKSAVIGRFLHDFVTPFAVVSLGGGDVIVSGAHYVPNRYAVSLIRTFHVTCQ